MSPDDPRFSRFYITDPTTNETRLRTQHEREEFDASVQRNKQLVSRIGKRLADKPDPNRFKTEAARHREAAQSLWLSDAERSEHLRAAEVHGKQADQRQAVLDAERLAAERQSDPRYQSIQESAAALTRSGDFLYEHLSDKELIFEAVAVAQSNLPVDEMFQAYWSVVEKIEMDNLIGANRAASLAQTEAARTEKLAIESQIRAEKASESLRQVRDSNE